MNRHLARTAFGRARAVPTTTVFSHTPSTFFPTRAAAPFSTTTARPEEASNGNNTPTSNNNNSDARPRRNSTTGRERSSAAAAKLSQLGNGNNTSSDSTSSSSSSKPESPRSFNSPRFPRAGSNGGVDARALRSPSTSSPTDPSASPTGAPRILNVRSLRGSFRGGRGGLGRFSRRSAEGGGEGGENGGRPRTPGFARKGFGVAFGAGKDGQGQGQGQGEFAGVVGRFGRRFGPGARQSGGFATRGRDGGARGRRAGRGGRTGERRKREAKDEGAGKDEKMKFSPEEKAVIDRLDRGEVVRFDPKVTRESLSGYGAAIATDAALGQVESAIRTMRLMSGGMAFNADSGVTSDMRAVMKRYEAKQPIFVNSKGEKEWIERAQPKLQLSEPTADIKKAIVDASIRGKYETRSFAELGDVKSIVGNYHQRTFTYKSSDSQKFMDKVLSLLPAQGRSGKAPAAQAKKTA